LYSIRSVPFHSMITAQLFPDILLNYIARSYTADDLSLPI